MRQELVCSYESFLQDVKTHQSAFSPSSEYIKEIETTVYNYPLFSSCSSIPVVITLCLETWSETTRSLVGCMTNSTIHQLMIHQEERVLKLARQSYASLTKQPVYGADCITICSIYRRPTEYTQQNKLLLWSEYTSTLSELVPSFESFCHKQEKVVADYTILVERTRPCQSIKRLHSSGITSPVHEEIIQYYTSMFFSFLLLIHRPALHKWSLLNSIQFPEKRLVEYDCGKLQVLSTNLFFHFII